jgi:peptide-methionine (S)-S-oxide reductase
MNSLKKTATLAAGCFWCVETIFKQLKGVESVVSGYSGGEKPNPSYDDVCSGQTGYAESVQISFDPNIISYEDLLKIFWTVHDPTTLNRQGADEGTQYRSAVFYHDEEQRSVAEKVKGEFDSSGLYDKKIVTEISPFTNFYPAEDYHQNYYENNSEKSYCKIVIDPKVQKFRKMWMEMLKK